MNFFEWKDNYSVGIKEIDDQHKKLFEIVNQLYNAFQYNTQNEEMMEILENLASYTKYHFKTEENLFTKYNYGQQKEHIALHEEFVDKVKKWIDANKAGKTSITYEIMNFLRNWLVNHIQDEDKKYLAFFQDKNIKNTLPN